MEYDYLFTRCGLPYGGCLLCNPEQSPGRRNPLYFFLRERVELAFSPRRGIRMTWTDQQWRDYCNRAMGDYEKTCPPQWDKRYARRWVPALIRIWKGDITTIVKKMLQLRKEHEKGTWGYRFYSEVIEILTDD